MPLAPFVAAAFVYSFSLVQIGPPLDSLKGGSIAHTTGSGVLAVALPARSTSLRTQRSAIRRASFAQRIGGSTLRFAVLAGELTAFADGSRLLALDVRVAGSDAPGCPVGSRGEFYLLDDVDGRDELQELVCPLRFEHYFNPLRGRVSISIR